MNYRLFVIKRDTKSVKYEYTVMDENGKIISVRKSNDSYVACTINGSHYFKSFDEIGKGDHGRVVKKQKSKGKTPAPIAYLKEYSESNELSGR